MRSLALERIRNMGKLIKGGIYSKPVKLEKYGATKPATQVKPQMGGGLSAKLPRK